eukprot:tig00021238_g19541.t1
MDATGVKGFLHSKFGVAFHVVSAFGTLFIVLACFSQFGPSVFTAHPVSMTVAVTLLLAEGVVVYRARPDTEKSALRVRHRNLQGGAVVFLCIGLIAILSAKKSVGESLVPHGVHEIGGVFTLTLLFLQAAGGAFKYMRLTADGTYTLRWHGKAGLGVFLVACVTVCAGIWDAFEGAGNLTRLVLCLLVWAVAGLAAYAVHAVQRPDAGAAAAEAAERASAVEYQSLAG